jgi:hypothetical protein
MQVMRWLKRAKEDSAVIGGNGYGKQLNQSYCPYDL